MTTAAARLFLACALLITLTACQRHRSPEYTPETGLAGHWELVSIDGQPITNADPREPVSLTIDPDGRVSGFAGVNRYASSLENAALTEGRFRLGGVGTTRMAGPPELRQFEDRYIQTLQRVDGYRLAANKLTLTRGDTDRLVFELHEPPAINNP